MTQDDFAFALGDDGEMHWFPLLDDGESAPHPLCGKSVEREDEGSDDDLTCEHCIPLFLRCVGLPADAWDDV